MQKKKLSSFCGCERWSIYLGLPLCRGSMSENEGKDKEAGSEDGGRGEAARLLQ